MSTTSSIGFGSISTNSSGSSNLGTTLFGINVDDLIDNLVEARSLANVRRQDLIDKNTSKLSAYAELRTLLTSVQTSAQALSNPRVTSGLTDTFDAKQTLSTASGSIAADKLYGVSADDTAVIGSYSLTISQIAKTDLVSGTQAFTATSATAYPAGGTLTINGTNITIDATTTLTQLRDKINQQSGTTKVSATIIQSGTNDYRLVLKGTETGKAIDLADGNAGATLTALGLAESGETDASLSANLILDGVPVTRSSNSVNDLITGVKIELYQADPGNPITLNVDNDLSGISDAVAGFIDSYNAFVDYVKAQRAVGTDGAISETQLLYNDNLLQSTYRSIQSSLAGGALGISAGTLKTLEDIGISLDENNKLVVDDSGLFEDALLTKLDEVRNLFGFGAAASAGISVVDRPVKMPTAIAGKTVTVTVTATDVDGLPTAAYFTVDGVNYTAEIKNGFIRGTANSDLEGFVLGYEGGVVTGTPYTGTFTPTAGIAEQMAATLQTVLDQENGDLKSVTDTLTDANTRLEDQILTLTNQLEIYRNRLVLQFQAAQDAINILESAKNSIKSFADSLNSSS
jgi:flagellar hook-associated protein 2